VLRGEHMFAIVYTNICSTGLSVMSEPIGTLPVDITRRRQGRHNGIDHTDFQSGPTAFSEQVRGDWIGIRRSVQSRV